MIYCFVPEDVILGPFISAYQNIDKNDNKICLSKITYINNNPSLYSVHKIDSRVKNLDYNIILTLQVICKTRKI